jgi:hypothetical protein
MADEPERSAADDEADRLIARAFRSVLDSVPELPGGEIISAEASPKSQPWAETAAPPGRNKRPLEELVAEFEERVAASPGAVANVPAEKHPSDAFLERFAPTTGQRTGRSRRRRARGGQQQQQQQQRPQQPAGPTAAKGEPRRGRRRGRRRRSSGGRGQGG